MNTRVLLRTAIAAVLLAAMPITALAVTSPTPAAAAAQRLTNLKTKGAAEIDRRVANLEAALAKFADSKNLTQSDIAELSKQIQTELTNLKALKAKLAAETDIAAARADVQSIVTDYRVYALVLPKTRLVASADRFTAAETKLTALHDQLETKAKAQTSSSYSLSAAEVKLQDMSAKITDAKAKSDSLVAKLLALQPTDYNANHTVLVAYRESLKTAQTDLKAARDDAKSVIDGLKAAK
jgi:chromosome segregation ATPase